jgi:hypothetical protein
MCSHEHQPEGAGFVVLGLKTGTRIIEIIHGRLLTLHETDLNDPVSGSAGINKVLGPAP